MPRFLGTVCSRQLPALSLFLLGGAAMLMFACMAMYGLELVEHSVPDHEDLHGLAPEQASFVGQLLQPSAAAHGIDRDGAVRRQERKVEGAPPQPGQRALPPTVRIDDHGLFKYVLLEVAGVGQPHQSSERLQAQSALLVRGSARFNFHKQNVMEAQKELAAMGLPPYAHACN